MDLVVNVTENWGIGNNNELLVAISADLKRFRQLTGLSPVQYINRLKIEKACQMLRSDDISPSAISDFLNFYSLPYFYKVFRDHTGMTPNQYREQDGAKEI